MTQYTNYYAKKRFGQNFLINSFIINEIIRLFNPNINDHIIEIGPGLGALTKILIKQLNHLEVVELDRDIIKILQYEFNSEIANNKFVIYEADALKFDFNNICNDGLRIIGNLPYNISTPLLFYLSNFNNIKDMHFMLQNEVVNRIIARPDCHDYGRLSVMLQSRYDCSHLLFVGKDAFDPKPKVDSAIVRLIPRNPNLVMQIDFKKLNMIVTSAFNQRRKTILNSLSKLIEKDYLIDTLSQLNIDTTKRAENITVDEYILLSKKLHFLMRYEY